MAKKKRSRKKSKPPIWSRLNQPRYRRTAGLIFILLATYLIMACTSYFFTWREDQDVILNKGWDVLLNNDVVVSNWLGRLGAVVSNKMIYWGFGVSSLVFSWVLIDFGLVLMLKKSLRSFVRRTLFAIVTVVIFSVVLEFIFRHSGFSWGGAFGEALYHWLTNFMGQIGLLTLLIFLTVVYFIWVFNPEMKDVSFKNIFLNLKYAWTSAVRPVVEDDDTDDITEADAPKEAQKPPTLKPSDDFSTPVIPDERGVQSELSLDMDVRNEEKDSQASNEELEISTRSTREEKLSIEEESKSDMPPYDPKKDLSNFRNPPMEILNDYENSKFEIDRSELEENKNQIIRTLLNYNIEITKIRATIGPTVTLYEIVPAPGVRISKIKNLEDDIALSLAALGIRIIAPIPGKGTIGIEVPNKKKAIVSFKEVINTDKFKKAKMDLPLALGKTISNEVMVADLAKMPHLLVAGATGQGKSVGINTMLMSMIYKKHPSQVKLVLIDPKKVELFPYGKIIKHYLAVLPNAEDPIITDTKKVVYTLNSLCVEMDQRYDLLKQAHARNIKEYNKKFIKRELNPNNGHRYMPFIVLVIDEFADLIMTAGKEIELPIGRLAQLARAVGIHLIIATQRPSVNIITGIIKANFPARLAFKVTSKVDSRTILDQGGAEQLIGRGDMLLSVGGNIVRLQGAFVDTPEVEEVLDFVSDQQGFAEPFYLPEYQDEDALHDASGLRLSELDEVFEDAARLIVREQYGSTSMIQRKMKLGYNRAGRIMDQLEALGVVGSSQGSKPREVLVVSEMELDNLLEEMRSNV